MKILHVIGQLVPGGSEKMTLQVAQAMRDAGHDHRVAVLGELDCDFVLSVGAGGVPLWAPGLPDKGGFSGLRAVGRLANLARNGGFQVLQGHAWRSSIAAGLAGRIAGVPAVATLHRIYYPRVERWVDPIVSRLWRAVVVDSFAVRELLVEQAGLPRQTISVIPNFVSNDLFALETPLPKEDDSPFRILMAAHFTPVKGHLYALRALAHLEASRPGGAELDLLGDGPLLAECKSQVASMGLQHAVRFHGRRSDLEHWLLRADVVLLPSLWEGFGVILAEGMACGKPAVAFDIGGAAEVIEDGETGFLTPPADVSALTVALTRLRDDICLRRSMGQAGRLRAERLYGVKSVVTEYERFYGGIPSGQ